MISDLRDAAIVLAVILLRLAWVHFHEFRECRWCRKGGLIGGSWPALLAGHKPGPRKRKRCWRCNRTRLTRRWGAWHTHKLVISLQQAWDERRESR